MTTFLFKSSLLLMWLVTSSLVKVETVELLNCTGRELESSSGEVDLVVSDKPEVVLKIGENETEAWFWNSSFALLRNSDLNLQFICSAPYPIQWIQIHFSDGLEVREKSIWNERTEGGQFRSSLGLKGRALPPALLSNFSCQGVRDPCQQTNVIFNLQPKRDTLTLQTSQQLLLQGSVDEDGDCEAYVSYSLKDGLPGWKCETVSGKYISEFSEVLTCDSAAHCNTFFRNTRRGRKCLRFLGGSESCSFHCAYRKPRSFEPGFVTCSYQGLLLAQHFFHSVPQFKDQVLSIYFGWEEADPQKMLHLEPVTEETYFGDSVRVYCIVSRYYFAYGHRFALGFANGTIEFQSAQDGEWIEMYNVNRIELNLNLTDITLNQIYCLAPVWNSSEWVNQSASITIREDPAWPTFRNGTEAEDTEETVFLYSGERNKSILCQGYGRPTPTLTWNQTVPDGILRRIDETGSSMLIFPHVTSQIEGDYVCEIENFLGVQRKVFQVIVLDPLKMVVTVSTVVTCFVLFLCLLAMGLCWQKVVAAEAELRLLTEAEIKDFMEGNMEAVHANDYLDTTDLIQSLPYNTKFEIPKEMIHIDRGTVLGSGNFGEVLKGSVQMLESGGKGGQLSGMRSVSVAVKTVKRDMEVLYFKTLLSEVKIMAHIGTHPNIVTLVGACTQNIRKREIFIAVEFCDHGSLEAFLRKHRKSFVNLLKDDKIMKLPGSGIPYVNTEEDVGGIQILTTNDLIKWSREIANAMEFLGSKKIIHGDLATRNVFLSAERVAKIGDFGLSRQLLEYSNYFKNEECPLPWKWMAMESLEEMKFSVKSDVWAFGVTVWEIFTLANSPYPGLSWSPDFLDQLNNGMRMHKPSYATLKTYDVMLDCWNGDPNSRPTFPQLKNYFEGLMTDKSYSDYLQFQNEDPSATNYVDIVEGKGLSATNAGYRGSSPPLQNDRQGYLIPLIEPHLI